MKLSLAVTLSLSLVAVLAPAARADDASAIAAASAWWKQVSDWSDPPASKKAPIHYAIDSKHPKCKKLKVGKASSAKQADKLTMCVTNAYLSLIPAEIDFTPTETGWEATSEPYEMLFSKKQRKAIDKAVKGGATVLSNTISGQDEEETVQVFIAVGPDDVVRGIFMITSSDIY